MYTTYDFTNFNYTDSLINIHKNSIFYRGIRDIESINNLNILRNNVPIYLSSKDSAKQYSSNNPNNIYSICITDDIKVFDLRKIQLLLEFILDSHKYKENEHEFKFYMGLFSIALGLVDYKTQIHEFEKLAIKEGWNDSNISQGILRMKHLYTTQIETFKINRGPFNKKGFRIAITDIDEYMTLFLKELFGKICDGYIAPKMLSPLQPDYYIVEELVLFNTDKLKVVENIQVYSNHINSLIEMNNLPFTISYREDNFKFNLHTGGSEDYELLDKNMFFNKNYKKNVKLAKRLAKKLSKDFILPEVKNVKSNNNSEAIKLNLKWPDGTPRKFLVGT